jgi:hypothetical protein
MSDDMIGKLSCAGNTEVDGATSANQNCEQRSSRVQSTS